MGRNKMLSEREKGKIAAYIDLNLSKRDIARRMRRSVCCITTFINNGEKYGKNFKGSKRALSPRACRRLRKAASNSTESAKKLEVSLSLNVSRWTVTRRLNEMNLKRKLMKSKPVLTTQHKEARIEFCRTNMKTDWAKIWFTDEKRWCLDGPDCFSYYWHDLRKEPLLRSKRQGGGGSLMMWGGICGGKITSPCFIRGTLDSVKYQEVLAEHFLPFCQPDESLVQDNAPIHVSSSTKEWVFGRGISTLKWPSRSPDMNPMENVWGIMARQVYAEGKQYLRLQDLQLAIIKCWHSLNSQRLAELSESMNNRVFQCITRGGGHVDY
jgi:transposase